LNTNNNDAHPILEMYARGYLFCSEILVQEKIPQVAPEVRPIAPEVAGMLQYFERFQ
jgi:hypothetical protein